MAIDPLRAETPATLLRRASWVRERAAQGVGGDLRRFINAEEALVCVALENALVAEPVDTVRWRQYRDALQQAFGGRWPAVVPQG